MPVTNYFNMNRGNIGNQIPGFSQKAFIAPLGWFDSLQDPGADGVTITLDHTFLTTPTGAGFVQLYALPKSVEAPGETNGEPGALNLNWKPKLFIPGDDAATQKLIETLQNDDVIVMLEDAKAPNGARYQFGNKRTPCSIVNVKPSSGTRGNGQKGWEIELEAVKRYVYSGAVTMMA